MENQPRIYFDNAATTPLDPEVFEAMRPFFFTHFGNPSSIHSDGRTSRNAIENARKIIAKYLNCSLGEVFFTSCGTESNNTALKCAIRDLGVQRIITGQTEHHCVLHTVEALERDGLAKIEFLKTDSHGRPDLEHLEELLADSSLKTMVSLMHANNEIGVMIDLDRVSALTQQYNALLHSDTVQTIGRFPFDLQKTQIDFLAGSAHKFHGPKGIGFLYINNNNRIKPFIDGGAQERNIRAGTENLYGIVGLAKALELASQNLETRKAHIEGLRTYMISKLIENIPGIKFNSDLSQDYLYTVLNICLPNTPKSELVLFNLDINGISASGGSACASGTEKASHVLAAINKDSDCKAVRFSFSHLNTKEEIDFVVEKLKKTI